VSPKIPARAGDKATPGPASFDELSFRGLLESNRRPIVPFTLSVSETVAAVCLTSAPGRYAIEVVDVLSDPQRGLSDGVLMTTRLVRQLELAAPHIVRTLFHRESLLEGLGLLRLEE